MDKQSFIICSYYTVDNSYAEVAHQYLMPSVSSLKLKSDICGIQSLGSWAKNTSYKAQFIATMLERHKENIVFVDCDAEILQTPDLFEHIPDEFNFAAHVLDRNQFYGRLHDERIRYELLSGTLFIRNNGESRKLVNEWNMACQISNLWEQKILDVVLKKNNVKVYELPIEYTWIRDLPDGRCSLVKPNGPIIIRHNQVSRQLKHKIL